MSLVLVAVMAPAATAHAAVTIGSNLLSSPTVSFSDTATFTNASLPPSSTASGGLVAPADGVITSWAVRRGGDPPSPNTIRLRVLAGNSAASTGRGQPTPSTSGVTSFPERMPIAAGQTIGLHETYTNSLVSMTASTPMATLRQWNDPFPDATNRPPDFSSSNRELLIQATIEPDTDADGFGDETQDGCLGVGGPQGGCPNPPAAPETQIDSGPSGKLKKTRATFSFSSPSAGASFECALDKIGFSDCASPKKLKKLANGKHKFRVRAVSAEGLIDRTPAEQSFKVKLSKKQPAVSLPR